MSDTAYEASTFWMRSSRTGSTKARGQRTEPGEIWLYTSRPPDKRRPVLIISRQAAIRFLRRVVVAPVSSP